MFNLAFRKQELVLESRFFLTIKQCTFVASVVNTSSLVQLKFILLREPLILPACEISKYSYESELRMFLLFYFLFFE